MMSHFAITADEVNKILAQAKFLTRDVDGQRYEAEKWSQLFAKLPREYVKKIFVVLGGEEKVKKIEFCLLREETRKLIMLDACIALEGVRVVSAYTTDLGRMCSFGTH